MEYKAKTDSRRSSDCCSDTAPQKPTASTTLDVVRCGTPSNLLPVSPSMQSNGIHRGGNNGDSRRSSMVDATGRFCSQPISGSPEILVGLCYDDKHEVVSVSIEKASTIGHDIAHPPDSFVKILGVDEFNTEVDRHKTETFAKDNLETSTVRVEVWTVSGLLRRKQLIGSISIGFASSSPDANEHWQQMLQGAGITISKWHAVQPPNS